MSAFRPLNNGFERVVRNNDLCQKNAAVEGVGPLIATAMVAAVADGKAFRNGRQFAAWLGLVPRQHSSGDKQRLLGITKRGDPYCGMLLVHGARSVVVPQCRKDGSQKPMDRRQAAKAWNHQSLCRRGEQERADHLGAAGQR